VRFLVDTQLPPALARWLIEHDHEGEHVLNVGLAQGKDNAVWQYAIENKFVIVTKDEDFAEWIRRGRPGPSVVWIRFGNSSTGFLLKQIESLWPAVVRQLSLGERLIEVR